MKSGGGMNAKDASTYTRAGTIRLLLVSCCTIVPSTLFAQIGTPDVASLHQVLEELYADMLPLCSRLIGVSRGIAGFAATWYIGSRIWRHLARAEAVDFYPLFRPFAIGLCLILFPSVLDVMNAVLRPAVTATSEMVGRSDVVVREMLKQKQEAMERSEIWQIYVGEEGSGDRQRWYTYTQDEDAGSGGAGDEGFFEGIGNDIKFSMEKAAYRFRHSIKEWLSEILQLIFQGAALAINTLRTFQLIVLAILGPLVFGISVFDGFQHSLTVWIARYINIYLWLPIANIFGSIIGKIQEKMLVLDLSQIEQAGDTFFSQTDMAYLTFLFIGILGYFMVPSVANYIVHAGGGAPFAQRVGRVLTLGSRAAAGTAAVGAGMVADQLGDRRGEMARGMADQQQSAPYFNQKEQGADSYSKQRLRG